MTHQCDDLVASFWPSSYFRVSLRCLFSSMGIVEDRLRFVRQTQQVLQMLG